MAWSNTSLILCALVMPVCPLLCACSADLPTAPVVAVVSGNPSIYDAKVLAYTEATPRTLNKHYAQAHQVQTKDSHYG